MKNKKKKTNKHLFNVNKNQPLGTLNILTLLNTLMYVCITKFLGYSMLLTRYLAFLSYNTIIKTEMGGGEPPVSGC